MSKTYRIAMVVIPALVLGVIYLAFSHAKPADDGSSSPDTAASAPADSSQGSFSGLGK